MGRSFDDEYVRLAEAAYDEGTQASCDRRQREALERGSPSASRRDLVSILNAGERQRTASADVGLDAIAKVRNGGDYGSYNPFRNQTRPQSNFDFQPSDPGNQPGRFGGFQEGAPKLRSGRVGDAEGSLRSSDARARDHWASGKVESVPTSWMLAEARRLITAVRDREYGRKPV